MDIFTQTYLNIINQWRIRGQQNLNNFHNAQLAGVKSILIERHAMERDDDSGITQIFGQKVAFKALDISIKKILEQYRSLIIRNFRNGKQLTKFNCLVSLPNPNYHPQFMNKTFENLYFCFVVGFGDTQHCFLMTNFAISQNKWKEWRDMQSRIDNKGETNYIIRVNLIKKNK